MAQKTIVISGINMVEGGIFTILHNCLQRLAGYSREKDIKIYALVHDASVFQFDHASSITFIEFPKSKKNWLNRLYYEYVYFKKLSRQLQADVWFSLHDVTPNVSCKSQFVYCHNPSIFYKPSVKDWFREYKYGVFHLFYKSLYQKNITRNKAVFVQQHWIKDAFRQLFSIDNVYVANPETVKEEMIAAVALDPNFIHFFYPGFARIFKNFELIGEALKLLSEAVRSKIRIHLTLSENDNAYARHITTSYPFDELVYTGKLSRAEVFGYYEKMDCLLFPSKIETWGLPITEAKSFGKPVLLADLPYAKESVGTYDGVSFFDPENPAELAQLITEFVSKTIRFEGNNTTFEAGGQFNNWNSLFDFILKD